MISWEGRHGWRSRNLRPVLGGPDILAYLVLALGAAMAVGSLLALVRPPEARAEHDLERPPLVRSLVFAAVGALAALWAVASLVS